MKAESIKDLDNNQTQKKTHPRKVKKERNWDNYSKSYVSSKNNNRPYFPVDSIGMS